MIPLNKPFFDDEELNQVSEVFKSGWVSQGPKNIEFEEKVCKYLGVKYAIPVCNATAGLHLSLLAIDSSRLYISGYLSFGIIL